MQEGCGGITFSNEQDIVEQIVALRRRLQQRDEGCVFLGVDQVSQVFDDLEGCRRVQAR